MTVRVALVGCGRISVRHAELLTNQEIDGAELAAVCDLDPNKAQATGEKYGVPSSEILVELGERKTVGGQEDMIEDVALNIAHRRNSEASP